MDSRNPCERKIACVLIQSADLVPEFAEACFRFSPLIAVRAGEAIFIDYTRTSLIYSPASITARVQTLAARFGLHPHVGTGTSPARALVHGRFGTHLNEALPLSALHDFASPFRKDAELAKKTTFLIESLLRLGLKTVRDFTRLPTQTLASRFGEDGVWLSQKIKNENQLQSDDAWPGFHPLADITEKFPLPDVEGNLEGLLFTLRGMLDRAMARLRGRCLRASVIGIRFRTENKREREWKIGFPLPQGSVTGTLLIIRERLAFDLQMRPLECAVTELTIAILETAPGNGAQRDFFDSREEQAEAWNALVSRLSQKLGHESAFTAQPVNRYLPEKAWRREVSSLLDFTKDPIQRSPERPARMLAVPEPLQRMHDYLIHTSGKKRWRILEWTGPERLSGEWWSNTAYQRDYFRVLTEGGEKLWIFITPQPASTVFLHGFFD